MAKVKIKRLTPEFRVSYPHVFAPHAVSPTDKAKYGLTMLFPKNADMTWAKTAIVEAMTAKFGPDRASWPKIKNPIRDGDDGEAPKEGYKGMYFLTARSDDKPGVIDANGGDITQLNQDVFYAGCYARATVVAFYWERPTGKGVGFALNNVQKLREGEPFSSKTSAADDFGVAPGAAPAQAAAAAAAPAKARDDIFA